MLAKRIGGIMSRDVLAAAPGQSLREILKEMLQHDLSCVPVVEKGMPVGLLTRGDLLQHLVKEGLPFPDCPASEVMRSEMCWTFDNMLLFQALCKQEFDEPEDLLVLNRRGALAGRLSLVDVFEALDLDTSLEEELPLLGLSSHSQTLDAATPLPQALAALAREGTGCIVAMQGGSPVGILTSNDVVALALQHSEPVTLDLCEAMRGPVACLSASASLSDAVKQLRSPGVRETLLLDAKGRPAGVLTTSHIVRGVARCFARNMKTVLADTSQEIQSCSQDAEILLQTLHGILHDSLDMGIVVADAQLQIQHCNPCAERLLGYKAKDILGSSVCQLHAREGVAPHRLNAILNGLQKGMSHTFEYQHPVAGAPHHFRARVSSIRRTDGSLLGYVYLVRDVTAEKHAEENIHFMAYHDMLTGLPNRISLEERFHLEASRADRKQQRIALMLIDMNRFKAINDTLGHFSGDLMLQKLAKRLKASLRKSDTVARIGGDEFVILLPELFYSQDAVKVAEKVKQSMSRPFKIRGELYSATLSMGVCMYPENGSRLEELLEKADAVMYEAKRLAHAKNDTCYLFASRQAPMLKDAGPRLLQLRA